MKGEPMRTDPGHRWLSQGAEVLVHDIEVDPAAAQCDVLIIGSGYGGAVAAARLAGARPLAGGKAIRVVVLERGNEYLPGEFPATFGELPGHVRFSGQDGRPPRGRPSGLFDLRLGNDVSVLLGNGLGGGSLINAAVMEPPTSDAFTAPGWPAAITEASLQPGYDQARAMLEPEQIPGMPAKLASLLAAAAPMAATEARKAYASVAFADGFTQAGVELAKCLECGDCVSGCNHRAKKSLDVNYLALAKAKGAELYCGATVHVIRALADPSAYDVEFALTDPQKAPSERQPYRLRATQVILAAGALGSTEILLRSRELGLPVSDALGRRFSTNGDMIAAAYGQSAQAHVGTPEAVPPAQRKVGPTITGIVRVAANGARPLVFEEFGIPAALYRLLGEVVTTTAMLQTRFEPDTGVHRPGERGDDPLAVSAEQLDHTQVYGMMGDDGAAGRLLLQPGATRCDGQIAIEWRDVGALKLFDAQLACLRAAHEDPGPSGGRVLPSPLWRPLPPLGVDGFDALSRGVFTVHPLGGCTMGADATSGVVDHAGRVFWVDGAQPTLPGLAVLDGSIVPISLGINPALTIAALAERALPMLARDWNLALDTASPSIAVPRPLRADRSQPQPPAGTRFTLHERMRGRLRLEDLLVDCNAVIDFEPTEVARLRQLPRVIRLSRVELEFTDPSGAHPPIRATCTGQAEVLVRDASNRLVRRLRAMRPAWRRLSPYATFCRPISATQWRRHFLALCTHLGTVRLIRYRLSVTQSSDDSKLPAGAELCLTKRLEFTDGGNPWRQLSEGVFERVDACRVELGKLETDLGYFAEQMVPLLRIEQQQDAPNALGDLAELALWILRVVLDIHLLNFLPPLGEINRNDKARLPGAVNGQRPEPVPLPANKEPMRPERLLSHYAPKAPNPDARPVLLVHGYGASGSTFTHPAIGSADGRGSLASALLEAGRDVWVLDLRTSIGLSGSRAQAWMFDETAHADIPEAIAEVLRRTGPGGEGKVDVVAHCIGAAMFSVAVLGSATGLHERIGCAVLSQVAPLVAGSPMNRLRAYVAAYLQQYLGVQWFDVRASDDVVTTLLVDGILATFPYPDDDGEAERLHEKPGFAAVRHRADAIFGQTMRLSNIGDEMLGALDAIYGFVSTPGLAQVGHYVSRQVLTDAAGQNQHIAFETIAERFGFPLLIVHGRHNRIFDWRGSYRAFALLQRVFEDDEAPPTPPRIDGDDDLQLGAGTARRLLLLGTYGHQDTLIGRRAHHDVFPRIVGFLDEFASLPKTKSPTEPPPLVVRLPWTGPTLGAVQRIDKVLQCRIALRAPPGHASTLAVLFVPAVRTPHGWEFIYRQTMAVATTTLELIEHALVVNLRHHALPRFHGFAVLTVHSELPRPVDRSAVIQRKADKEGLFVDPESEPVPDVLKQVEALLASQADPADTAVVRLDPAWIEAAQRPGEPPQRSLRLALASCQYPAGLFDDVPAQASSERLARRLDNGPAELRPQLLLLMGDQVYVDDTAGVFSQPGASAIERAYEVNHRLPAYRRVTRSLPTYPMLDDHEVGDNWEPPAPLPAAISAYVQRQHKLVDDRGAGPFTYGLRPAGLPVLVLDTRSTRDRRVLRQATDTALLQQAQITTAQAADPAAEPWRVLLSNGIDPALPKFLVSPVAVFPLPRAAAFGHGAERIALDDWSGFPRSQLTLLQAVRDLNVRNVVLLSGDRHMSSASSMWLRREDDTEVEIISIVSSGLYAPWPFANAQPQEHWLDGPFKLDNGALAGRMATPLVGRGDGYAVVSVSRGDDGVWTLDVVLDLADGEQRASKRLDGRPDTPWQVWR